MPGGLSLGGAFFTLYGDNAQILQTMAEAKQATLTATKAMADAQAAYAQAAIATSTQARATWKALGDSYVQDTQRASAQVKQLTAVLESYGVGVKEAATSTKIFGASLKEIGATVATLTGFGAIASGALVVREAFLAVADATQKLNTAQFALNRQFAAAAPFLQEQAKEMANLYGKSYADAIQSVNQFATVNQQYGVRLSDLGKIELITANAAAIRGTTLEEAAKRIAPALRGEAEAIEYLGFSLQSDYLKSLQDVNSEEYKHWQQMGPRAKQRIILNELEKQAATQQGAAAAAADSAAGATAKMGASFEKAAAALGQRFNPLLVSTAKGVAGLLDSYTKWMEHTDEVARAVSQLGHVPFNAEKDPEIQAIIARNRANDAAAKQAAIDTDKIKQDRLDAIEDTKTAIKELDAYEKEKEKHDVAAENELYEAKKAALEVDKAARIQAATVTKEAALDGIRAEKLAAEDLYQSRLAQLQVQKAAQLQAAEDRHTASIRELNDEKDRVQESTKLEVRRLEDTRDAALRSADLKKQIALDQIEQEKRDRDIARTAEDRALADSTEATKRAAQDKHEANTRFLEAEAVAIRAHAEEENRAIEATAKKAEAKHRDRLLQLEAQGKSAEKKHAAALRQIDIETTAAEEQHRLALVGIEAEQTAAKNHHDTLVRAIDDQLEASKRVHDDTKQALDDELAGAQKVHDQRNRALADQVDAAQRLHDITNRGLEDQLAAAERVHGAVVDGLEAEKTVAQAVHEQTVRNLADQLAAAERLHQAEQDALAQRKQYEDARHADAMANLDAELKAQTDGIDAQLRLLDDQQRSDTHSSRLEDLQKALEAATGTGNAAAIAKAQRDIQEEQANFERDQLRSTLQAAKENVKDRIDTEKDLAKTRHDQIEDGIAEEDKLSDARFAATKDAIAANKQLADDTYTQTQASIALRKDQADRELDLIRQTTQAQKQANDDALALIKRQADADKQSNDDQLDQVRDRIDARKREIDDALEKLQRESADRKQALDDELARIETELASRKAKADEDLRLTRVVLDARKLAADDEYTSRKNSLDKQKLEADAGYQKDKDRIDKRKLDVKDETDALVIELGKRKDAEADRYLAEQRDNEDTHKLALQKIQDRRTAEDTYEADRRTQVEREHTHEQQAIRDTADLAITKSKDALAAYEEAWGKRKLAVDDQYHHEQDEIRKTFDDPITGLIPKLKKAYDDTKEWYDKRTIEVNKQYENERNQITATFDDKETGLFAKLKSVHDETVKGLEHVKEDWEENFQKPIALVAGKTYEEVRKALFDKLKADELAVKAGEGNAGGRQGGPGGDGPGPVPGGIPSPWRVTFPYDAPYNGPYGGGAMWPGGPPRHQGIDLALPGPNNGMGKPYPAFQPGRVYWQGYEPAGGNGMIIQTDDGLFNYYGHSQRFLVNQGDRVEAGQDIGILGESGTEGSPHLHYAVRRKVNSDHIDPVPYLSGARPGGDPEGAPPTGSGVQIKDGYIYFTLFGQQYKVKLPVSDGTGPNPNRSETYQRLLRAAQTAGSVYDLPAGIIAAIPIQEGINSQLQTKYHNLFSIKGTGPAGSVNLPSDEIINGQRVSVNSDFRVYHDEAESFMDFGKLMTTSGIYDDAIELWKKHRDPKEFIRKVGKRYATDPDWAESVLKIAGYAHGGYIPEPTLLVGQTLGPYAIAGESKPEWVTPQAPGAAPTSHTSIEMPIMIGNREVERLWIDGYNLNVKRGRHFGGIS